MLRMTGDQVETLWDALLPAGVRALPEDLARLDVLLGDPALLRPIAARWDAGASARGRPTIPMSTYVRLMVVKQRTGWGYETLVREVSDSLHLRRFCLIALDGRVPDESTVRKLTRRLGPGIVAEMTRALIAKAQRETRFRARAVRVDSTVIEADIRYPSDAVLALQGVRALARQGRRASAPVSRGASRTSSAAMGCATAASKASRAPASGAAGRSWPTTSTLTATTPEPGPGRRRRPSLGAESSPTELTSAP